MDIRGKNALVLGASRGVGRAIARKLADAGMRLFLPWFDWPDACREMEAEFAAMEAGHLTLEVDLRNLGSIAKMVARIEAEFGSLDVLVNNIERGDARGAWQLPASCQCGAMAAGTGNHPACQMAGL